MIRKIALREPPPVDDKYSKRIWEFKDNLVAHWDLDDRTGAVAVDRTGRNDGTITGTTLGQPGIGDGLKSQLFDGSTSFVDISAIASELMLNGGFETPGGGGADIWANWVEAAGNGALANEVVEIHTGASAAKLTGSAAGDTYVYQIKAVVPAANYRLRFWTRADGANEGRYWIRDITNSGNIVALTGTGVASAAYTMVDVNFTTPAGCVSIFTRFDPAVVNGALAYYDTVSLRRTDIPSFDPHEGAIFIWTKASAGLWAGADAKHMLGVYVDPENYIYIRKAGPNELAMIYEGNDVENSYVDAAFTSEEFNVCCIAWSLSSDEIKYFINGDLKKTDTGVGVFVGNLHTSNTLLGASSQTPALVWDGWEEHCFILNKYPSDSEVSYLSSFFRTRGIFPMGDSKTDGDAWVDLLRHNLEKHLLWYKEMPTRYAGGGWKIGDLESYVTANLSAETEVPNTAMINIGTNDVWTMPAEGDFKADYTSVIDQLIAKYPSVKIYLAKVWRRNFDAECNTLAGWLDDIAGTYANVYIGMDERIWMENGDNGVTYTDDGIHPNIAAQQVCADAWSATIS